MTASIFRKISDPTNAHLFTAEAALQAFDGATYDHARDGKRLGAQMEAVLNLMKDGKPRYLSQITALTGAPEASVSARLRDLRKPKFGGYQIDRQYLGRGVWLYRMVLQEEGLS